MIEGAAAGRFFPDPATRRLRARTRAGAHPDEGRDAQPPDRDLALPGRRHRLGRRDPRRGRDRPRRQAQGGPHRLLGLEPAPARRARARGSADYGKPGRIATALDIMIDGPLGGAAFNNEFGRPTLCGYFRTFELEVAGPAGREVRGYHKPIMLAGGFGNIRAEHVKKAQIPAGAPIIVLGGPAMLIGLGGGAASSLALGRVGRGPRFRLGAARQRRDGAPLPGGDRPLLARSATDNPILSIHDVGAGRPLERAARAGARQRPRRALRAARRSRATSPGMSPLRDLVQRGAGALRAGDRRRARSPRSRRSARASAARSRSSARATDDGQLVRRRSRTSATARSTCRSRCCSASRRA